MLFCLSFSGPKNSISKAMNRLVSVIIPCYKQGHFLPDCVASLQRQTHVDWEAIIIDDGSPDEAVQIAQELASDDQRVCLIRQPNQGLSAARNTGLRHARGDYVQFLDADDLLLPRKFETHLKFAAVLRTRTVTYTDFFDSDNRGDALSTDVGRISCNLIMPRPVLDFSARWEHDLSIPIHTALFPRYLLQELDGPFDQNLPNHEDWDMWIRLACLGGEFAFIPEKLAIYCHGTHSMCRDESRMHIGFNAAIEKHMQLLVDDKESIRCLRYLSNVNSCRHSHGYRKGFLRAVVLGSSMLLPKEVRKILSLKWHLNNFIRRFSGRRTEKRLSEGM